MSVPPGLGIVLTMDGIDRQFDEHSSERADEDDGFLRDIWYFAMPSNELKRSTKFGKTLLGDPVLFARRSDGSVYALRDICPHRGIPLSDGRMVGDEIECCYHGWRFEGGGACTCIPSLYEGQDFEVSRVRVLSYPVREFLGGIWIYMPSDPRQTDPVVEPPNIPQIGSAPNMTERMLFPSHIDHAVIGLMDPAHGPFVHKSWYWRSSKSIKQKEKAFGPSDYGFCMLRHPPSTNGKAYKLLGGEMTTEIRFQLPGVRIEHVMAGRHQMIGLTTVTPIKAQVTEIHHMVFWTMPWLSLLKPILRPIARQFLGQDRDAVTKQQRGLSHGPTLMLINDSDVMAKWYFRLKKTYGAWRSGGPEFENPVKETTLKWRS